MTLSRREFLRRSAMAGGSLVIAAWLPELAFGEEEKTGVDFEPNVLIRISPDDVVTLTVIRHEMGQGVRTLLPMIMAEELEADWSKVIIEQAVTGPKFKGIRLHTSGSGTTRGTWDGLRKAGAMGREMLVAAAAEAWGVPASSCRALNGRVLHEASGRRLSYGALAGRAAQQPKPESPRLKEPSEFRFIGKSMKRIDGPDDRHRPRRVRHGRAGPGHGVRQHRASARAGREAGALRRCGRTPHRAA